MGVSLDLVGPIQLMLGDFGAMLSDGCVAIGLINRRLMVLCDAIRLGLSGAFSGLVAGLGRLLSLEVGTPVRTVLRRLILRWGGGPIIIPDQSRLSDRRPSDGGRWHRVMAGVVAYILGRAMDRAAAAPQQCQQTDGT